MPISAPSALGGMQSSALALPFPLKIKKKTTLLNIGRAGTKVFLCITRRKNHRVHNTIGNFSLLGVIQLPKSDV